MEPRLEGRIFRSVAGTVVTTGDTEYNVVQRLQVVTIFVSAVPFRVEQIVSHVRPCAGSRGGQGREQLGRFGGEIKVVQDAVYLAVRAAPEHDVAFAQVAVEDVRFFVNPVVTYK